MEYNDILHHFDAIFNIVDRETSIWNTMIFSIILTLFLILLTGRLLHVIQWYILHHFDASFNIVDRERLIFSIILTLYADRETIQ